MIRTESAPAAWAAAVSSIVSSIFAEPVPGRNGTWSATSSLTIRIASARSATVWALGSPVDPPKEMPCVPFGRAPGVLHTVDDDEIGVGE